MLFMVMHKVDAEMEKFGPPDQRIVTEMGALIGETIQAGKLHDAAGLLPSSQRVRLAFSEGKITQTRGPLTGGNELIAGLTMLKVKTLDEAVSWATRLAEALGATEIDVGPVTEAWDIGMGPKPDGEVPLRVLALPKADAQYEAGVPLSAEREAKLRQLLAEMKSAGVLLANEKLKPSSRASRLTLPVGGKRKLIDGPFAESKELVAGFTTVRVSSKDEAIAWARRYGDILDVNEIDIREVVEE